MPRQQRSRGQEVTLRLLTQAQLGAVQRLAGSFFKVRDFTWNDVGELKEDGFLGEIADDIDYQNSGFAGSFSFDKSDGSSLLYVRQLVASDRSSTKPPDLTIISTTVFRGFGIPDEIVTFTNGIMMMASENVSGRKDFINNAYEWKAKHLL